MNGKSYMTLFSFAIPYYLLVTVTFFVLSQNLAVFMAAKVPYTQTRILKFSIFFQCSSNV